MRGQSSRDGYTLIELMVAVAIMGVVTAQLLMVFSSQYHSYVGQERVVEVQQDARFVTDLMVSDIRMAGFLVPRLVALSSRDGGTNAPDALCVSDPSSFAEASITAAFAPFDGASLAFGSDLDENTSKVQIDAATRDIDGDGNDDFVVGQGIIIADGTNSHCARITGFSAPDTDITPGTPAGFFAASASAVVVPALIYEVSGAGLTRNGLLLSTQVEDVQVQFGIDLDSNGFIDAGEFPFDDLTGQDPAQVVGLELSVIARVAEEDPDVQGSGRPQAANHTAGTPDGFRRRRLTVSVLPRNLTELP